MSKPTLPGPQVERFYRKESTYLGLGVVGALGAVVAQAIKAIHVNDPLDRLGLATAVLALTGVAPAIFKWVTKTHEERDEPSAGHEIRMLLRMVSAEIREHRRIGNDGQSLRATVYRPHPLKTGVLEQTIDYVGGDEGGRGRTLNDRCGAVGKALHQKKTTMILRTKTDHAAFCTQMQTVANYTAEEARQLRSDRFAYLAVPIWDLPGADVIGVLYFDSDQPKTFTDHVIGIVERAASVIGTHYAMQAGT